MTVTVCAGDRGGGLKAYFCLMLLHLATARTILIQPPQSLWHMFFSSGLDLISDKESGLPWMVSQWFVVGTWSVIFLQRYKNHDNLERGTCSVCTEISTSDITKAWWGMTARGAEGHRLVQKRWQRLEKVEVGFWVMKGLEELRWQEQRWQGGCGRLQDDSTTNCTIKTWEETK